MHAELFGEVGLHDVELETAPLDVVTDGFWGLRNGLGAFPSVGVRATQDLDLQMAKGQRMALPRCSSTMPRAGCCTITRSGWRNWRRTNPWGITITTEPARITRMLI